MIRSPWAAPCAWAALIFVGTSIPGRNLPPAFPHADKLVHLVLYSVLGLLVARALNARRPTRHVGPRGVAFVATAALVAIASFAAFDEWHQDYVPGRSADRLDWLADVAGAAAGIVAGSTARRAEQRT